MTVICLLNVTWPCDWSKKKTQSLSYWRSYQAHNPPLLRPHVLETKGQESCCLSHSLVNLIILKQPSESCLELVIAVRIIFFFFTKTCSDFTWDTALLNQPDIICLGLSASLLPGRRNAALRGWMSTTADCKWRKEPVTVLPAQRNTHAGSWGPSLTWTLSVPSHFLTKTSKPVSPPSRDIPQSFKSHLCFYTLPIFTLFLMLQ